MCKSYNHETTVLRCLLWESSHIVYCPEISLTSLKLNYESGNLKEWASLPLSVLTSRRLHNAATVDFYSHRKPCCGLLEVRKTQTHQDAWKRWPGELTGESGQCTGHLNVFLWLLPSFCSRVRTPATWMAFMTSRSLLWSPRGWVSNIKNTFHTSSILRKRQTTDWLHVVLQFTWTEHLCCCRNVPQRRPGNVSASGRRSSWTRSWLRTLKVVRKIFSCI